MNTWRYFRLPIGLSAGMALIAITMVWGRHGEVEVSVSMLGLGSLLTAIGAVLVASSIVATSRAYRRANDWGQIWQAEGGAEDPDWEGLRYEIEGELGQQLGYPRAWEATGLVWLAIGAFFGALGWFLS